MIIRKSLNEDEIKELIAEKYYVDKDSITLEFVEPQDDGFYYDQAHVIFSFQMEEW